jgi:hypothetical protein
MLTGLIVGVKVNAKHFAVGHTATHALNVEHDGVAVVFVLVQTRRKELHELIVLLPDFLHSP